MPQLQINTLEDLEVGMTLVDSKNDEITILSITGELVWTSLPNQPNKGWRAWMVEDLVSAGIKISTI